MAGITDNVANSISNLSPELQRAFQMAVNAERKPIQVVAERKTNIEAKAKLLDDVLGKVDGVKRLLPDLNSPVGIRELAIESADPRVITGTVDKRAAEPGVYNVEVLQLASKATALSNGFPDKNETQIGSGYISFETASGETKEVFIDNDNATLEGMARSINSARVGLKATVINDQSDPENPFRLVLSADGTGSRSDVNYPEFYFVDGSSDFFIEYQKPAQNAVVRYEGIELESPTNELTDLIAGVTLSLKGVTDQGRPVSVKVEQDLPRTSVKVKELVDGLNQVFKFFQAQNKLDEKSDTRGTLGGDYGIRMAETRLRSALQENYLNVDDQRVIRSLADLGIQFTRNGTLSYDEKKLTHALDANFEDVVQLLARRQRDRQVSLPGA